MGYISKKASLSIAGLAALSLLGACAQGGGEDASADATGEATDYTQYTDPFNQSCGADIAQYCSEALPGDGRVASCLYGHQDLISDSCFAATGQTSMMLEDLFDRYYSLTRACAADINEYCADVEFGGGAKLMCLKENESKISSECSAELPAILSLRAEPEDEAGEAEE